MESATTRNNTFNFKVCRNATDYLATWELTKSRLQVESNRLQTEEVPPTLEGLLRPLDRLRGELLQCQKQATNWQAIHPDLAVREASMQVGKDVSIMQQDLLLSPWVWDRLQMIDEALLPAAADRYYLDTMQSEYKRNGAALDSADRETLKQIKLEIVGELQEFKKGINEDKRVIHVPVKKLDGIPSDYLAKRPADESGNIKISTSYEDVFPIVSFCKDPAVRKEVHDEWRSMGHPHNEHHLRRILELRSQQAKLLGYPSFAHYSLEDGILSTPEAVASFITEISDKLKPLAEQELAAFAKIEGYTWQDNGFMDLYYTKEVLSRAALKGFDTSQAEPYLLSGKVQAAAFWLFNIMFHFEFEQRIDIETWHPSVKVFDVYEGNRLTGRLYMDVGDLVFASYVEERTDRTRHAALSKGVQAERLLRQDSKLRRIWRTTARSYPRDWYSFARRGIDDLQAGGNVYS